MSIEDFNNGLIMGLSLQGTMFVDITGIWHINIKGVVVSPQAGIITNIETVIRDNLTIDGAIISPEAGEITEILKFNDYIGGI